MCRYLKLEDRQRALITKPQALVGEWRDNVLPCTTSYPSKSLVAGDNSPSMFNGLPLIQGWPCEMAEWPDLVCAECKVGPLRGEAYVRMCGEVPSYLCVKHREMLADAVEVSLRHHHPPPPSTFALSTSQHLHLILLQVKRVVALYGQSKPTTTHQRRHTVKVLEIIVFPRGFGHPSNAIPPPLERHTSQPECHPSPPERH